jgi:putative ATP-dependent endonuclease of the OLD family
VSADDGAVALPPAPAVAPPASPLRITDVRIQDVRAIQDLCVELGDTTVLVGENNVGKTAVLRALDLALGPTRGEDDDFRVDGGGGRIPEFVIDVRMAPAAGELFSDEIAGRLGDAVQLATPQFATLRTRGTASADGSGPVLERRWVAGWSCDRADALGLTELERPRSEQLSLVSFFLLDARRDLVEEVRQRRSYWGRLLSDVGISPAHRAALEATIAAVGQDVVDKSTVLTGIRDELDAVKQALGDAVAEVAIEALPARIDEVARAVDILLKAPGSAALPLRLQGLGSRSLAVVMVFNAYTRLRLGAGFDIPPLSVAAFEEPEAHLHPHPQRAMFELISKLPGQKIISTHSPFVTQVADLHDLRVLTRIGASIAVRSVHRINPDGSPVFDADALAKLRRFVQRNNGEALFARCVALHEGESEQGALAAFATHLWGLDPSSRGVSLVSVEGANNFQHYVRVLEFLKLPWVMLVDGDPAGVQGINSAEQALGRAMTADERFVLPTGTDFETHLVAAGHAQELLAAAAAEHGQPEIDHYHTVNHGQRYKGGAARDYQSAGWEDRLAVDFCKAHMKSVLGGRAIAEQLLLKLDAAGQPTIPPEIRAYLDRIDAIVAASP